jgi:hypothetical protein
MSTNDLIDRCRRMGIELTSDGKRLRVDAPRGAVDDRLRAELTARRTELIERLKPPPADPMADPIFLRLTDWLWDVIKTSNGEVVVDEAGRRWDVIETASRLYRDSWSMDWLDEVADFAKAMRKRSAKPNEDAKGNP